MIRFILCFINELVTRKLRSVRWKMKKMISHLFLVFGLFYGGFAVREASCAASEGTTQLKSASMPQKSAMRFGYHRGGREMFCNDCLKTVFQIIKKAADAKEEGYNYFEQFEPCSYFPYKQYKICLDVVDSIQDSGTLNIMDTRKFCARAKYCPPKNPVPVLITTDDSYSDDGDWYERKRGIYSSSNRCQTMKSPKSEPVVGYNLQNAETETDTALQATNPASTCQDCEAIIKSVKRFIFSNKPVLSFLLPFVCEGFRGQTKSYCFKIMSQYKEQIISLALEKKTHNAICSTIKQCVAYPYCRACQNYVDALKSDDYIAMGEACSYLQWNEKNQCKRSLEDKSDQITGLAYRGENTYKICKVSQLCPALPSPTQE